MLDLRHLDLDGLVEIRPPRFVDERGFFSETWNADSWRQAGIDLEFVQDNHSLSRQRGVLRGLHYQLQPFSQAKLVRVTRGSVFDVAVDIRRGSPTYGRWEGIVLSAAAWNQLLIPEGFAHGFVTLESDSEVQYKVSTAYSSKHERAIRYDDPAIGIEWPISGSLVTVSDRDGSAASFADAAADF